MELLIKERELAEYNYACQLDKISDEREEERERDCERHRLSIF